MKDNEFIALKRQNVINHGGHT